MRSGRLFEVGLLMSAAAATALAAFAYFYSFRSEAPGGPAEWAQFGDYFGGILGPILSVVTVIFIVVTLQTTRHVASETRDQMQAQIEQLKSQAILSDMQKRLDGVLSEWNRMLDQIAPQDFQVPVADSSYGVTFTVHTVREVIEDPARRAELIAAKLKAEDAGKESFPEQWKPFNHDLVPLLCELDKYCTEYEQASGSAHLTKFYKARVHQGLRSLRLAGLMPTTVANRLMQKPADSK